TMDQAHRPGNTEPPARPDDAPATVPHGGPAAGVFEQPWGLGALLALVVGALVWAFTRAGGAGNAPEGGPPPDPAAPRRRGGRGRAVGSARQAEFENEAERLYRRGLGLCREGDVVGTRQTWGDLVMLFQGDEAERPWVQLAESGLEQLKDVKQPAAARQEAVR